MKWHITTLGDPSAPALLFLHGFLGSHYDWLPLAEQLSTTYFCLLPDLPGHGLTRGHDYHMETVGASLLQALPTSKNLNLLAYSMGGRLGLYLLLKHSKHFTKAILESTSPGLKTESERAQRRQSDSKLAQRILSEDFSAFLQSWYQLPLFGALNQIPNFQSLLNHRLNNDPKELQKSLEHMGTGTQPNLWPELSQLHIPTLLITGQRDPKYMAIAQEMISHSEQFSQVALDAAHNVHAELPGVFIHQIQRFLYEKDNS